MQKSKLKPMAPRVPETNHKWLSDLFPSANAGAEWVLGNFPSLYIGTLAELRGRFSRGELSMMIDAMNGCMTLFTAGGVGLAGQRLLLSIYDSFRLYPGQYEEKWSVEADELNGKLQACTRFQVVCLELWSAGFWEREDYQDVNSIPKHCKILEDSM